MLPAARRSASALRSACAFAARTLPPPLARAISVRETRRAARHADTANPVPSNNNNPQSNANSNSKANPKEEAKAAARPPGTPLSLLRCCGVLARALAERNADLALAQLQFLLAASPKDKSNDFDEFDDAEDEGNFRLLTTAELAAAARLLAATEASRPAGPAAPAVRIASSALAAAVRRARSDKHRTGGPASLPPAAFAALIRCHAALQRSRPALALFRLMRRERIPIDTPTFNLVAAALAADGNHAAVAALIDDALCAPDESPKPDLYSYLALIDAHAVAAAPPSPHPASAPDALVLSRTVKIEQDKLAHLQHQRVASNSNRVDPSLPHHDPAATPPLSPDALLNDAISESTSSETTIKSHHQTDDALEIFNLVKERGIGMHIQLFNHLIRRFARQGAVDSMLLIFNMLKTFSFEPSTVTYNNMIHGYVTAGLPERAMDMLKRMVKDASTNDIRRAQCAPDVATYNILIDMHAKARDGEGAARVLDSMSQRGVNPDVVSFNTVMEAYRRAGYEVARVHHVFQAIESHGLRPSHASYTILMAAYGFSSQVAEAERVMQSMTTVGGITPKRSAYGVMIGIYSARRDYAAASRLFENMLKRGVQPDARMVETLMMAALRDRQGLDQVEKWYALSTDAHHNHPHPLDSDAAWPVSIGDATNKMRYMFLIAMMADGGVSVHEAVDRAWGSLLHRHEHRGARRCIPDAATVNVVIDAVERRPDVAARYAISELIANTRNSHHRDGSSSENASVSVSTRLETLQRAAQRDLVDRRDVAAAAMVADAARIIGTQASP